MTETPGESRPHEQPDPAGQSDETTTSPEASESAEPLVTPDGRYLIVRGRLWRRSDPALTADDRARLVAELMDARRDKKTAIAAGDERARESARQRVDRAKRALGERGPVWWEGNDPDLTRNLARSTMYADWFAAHEH